MAEKQGRSGHAEEDSLQLIPYGDWPNINLKLTDHTGTVDYGYASKALEGEQEESASAGNPDEGAKTWTLEIHTKLTLDEATFREVRKGLQLRNTAGRQKAHADLARSGEYGRGGPAAKKLIRAALES